MFHKNTDLSHSLLHKPWKLGTSLYADISTYYLFQQDGMDIMITFHNHSGVIYIKKTQTNKSGSSKLVNQSTFTSIILHRKGNR